MDYRQFEFMRTAVPNLYRNSGVLRYGGPRKRGIQITNLDENFILATMCSSNLKHSGHEIETTTYHGASCYLLPDTNFLHTINVSVDTIKVHS